MPSVIKSPEAQRDLDEITLYIARDSVDAALKWYDQLDLFFGRLSRAPGMGTSRDTIQPGLRSVPFGNYLIFFRKMKRGIEIVRVIHGAQKWERLFKQTD